VARYHGRNGKVLLSTTGSGTANLVGSLSSWSLSFARDKVDVTAFADTNKQYVVGLKDLSGSFEGFFDDSTIATLYSAGDSADGIKAYFYPSTDAGGIYFYGPAWLDVTLNTSVGDAVKVSGSISANGDWGAKTS
jgi:hypothetical protein